MKKWIQKLSVGIAAVALLAPMSLMAATGTQRSLTKLENDVRHELVMLPWYSIFDDLKFEMVDGNHVILSGYATRPTLKSDAENVVKRIEGVESVTNNIEVLPLSPFDDRIRIAVARSIFGYGGMYRYAMGSQPPLHIIVKNGNVLLEGYVSSEMDKNIANIRANGVPGVFSVTNNLVVDRG